jgi:hypothetical protein
MQAREAVTPEHWSLSLMGAGGVQRGKGELQGLLEEEGFPDRVQEEGGHLRAVAAVEVDTKYQDMRPRGG